MIFVTIWCILAPQHSILQDMFTTAFRGASTYWLDCSFLHTYVVCDNLVGRTILYDRLCLLSPDPVGQTTKSCLEAWWWLDGDVWLFFQEKTLKILWIHRRGERGCNNSLLQKLKGSLWSSFSLATDSQTIWKKPSCDIVCHAVETWTCHFWHLRLPRELLLHPVQWLLVANN